MSWAQRLRRVFDIDVSRCPHCGAQLRVLAVITAPRLIAAILADIETRAARGCGSPAASRDHYARWGYCYPAAMAAIECTTRGEA